MRAARHAPVIPSETISRMMVRSVLHACSVALLRGAFLLALLLTFSFAASADVAVPPLTGRVVDQTGTLSASEIASLTQKLRDFEDSKGSQIAVLIVPTTQPETIEQFSIRVADAWKVGRKKIDDGAILVIAKNDRHLRIEVGYGLEGALTDATSRRIIDEVIAPRFRSGDFAGGISGGVDRMMGVVKGEPLPAPAPPQWQGSSDLFDTIANPFVIFAVFAFSMMFRTIFGRLVGAAASGGVVGLVVWLIAGSLAASLIACIIAFIFTLIGGVFPVGGPIVMGRGGSWPGGGGGWGRSGGGFGGGGGGFGGGGASGSW